MRLFFRLILVIGGLLVVYAAYVVFTVWHSSTLDQRQKADAIVVMGAAQYNGRPSAVLRARLDHAVELWRQGLAPRIVVTGGAAPGDRTTEAAASARYLGSKGVPDTAILREVQGRTSWQSLQASARFLEQRNVNEVILVSDAFHNARIAAMASQLGLQPLVSPTRTSPIAGASELSYFAKELLAVGVGKVFGFERVAAIERNLGCGASETSSGGVSFSCA